jgi:hypothetical protein
LFNLAALAFKVVAWALRRFLRFVRQLLRSGHRSLGSFLGPLTVCYNFLTVVFPVRGLVMEMREQRPFMDGSSVERWQANGR